MCVQPPERFLSPPLRSSRRDGAAGPDPPYPAAIGHRLHRNAGREGFGLPTAYGFTPYNSPSVAPALHLSLSLVTGDEKLAPRIRPSDLDRRFQAAGREPTPSACQTLKTPRSQHARLHGVHEVRKTDPLRFTFQTLTV